MEAAGISDGGIRSRGLRSMLRRSRNNPERKITGASISRASARSLRDAPPGQSRRRSIRSFWSKEHGGAALETALALSLAVAAFAGLMEIVNIALESDRMNRAARAAAQATALDPNADACAAIRRDLHLANDFDCAAWTIAVRRGVLPSKLSNALGSASVDGTGDMVLVRIDWSRSVWPLANIVPAANAADAAPDASSSPRPVSRIAIGLARSEPPG